MGLLQGLLALLRSSAKKIVDAIFGWAVDALFGTTRAGERPLLSAVVGAAAVWPLLLLGVPFPKIAAFVLLLIPIPSWVSSGAVRAVWIGFALAVPAAVGLVLARFGVQGKEREPFAKRALRGIPVTAGLAASFLVALVTSPVRRAVAFWRGWKDEHLPLLIDKDDYETLADRLHEILEQHVLRLRRAKAPWLLVGPSRVLRALGGRVFEDRIPRHLRFYRSRSLEAAIHPTGVTLQGEPAVAARAHALLTEQATFTAGLQTTDAEAQELEKELKQIWRAFVHEANAHPRSKIFRDRIAEISGRLAKTFLAYGEWQILYREVLQMSRAVAGQPQVLESVSNENGGIRETPGARISRTSRVAKELRSRARTAVDAQEGLAKFGSRAFQGLVKSVFRRR